MHTGRVVFYEFSYAVVFAQMPGTVCQRQLSFLFSAVVSDVDHSFPIVVYWNDAISSPETQLSRMECECDHI